MEKERLITVKGIGVVTVPVDYVEITLTLDEMNKDYKKGYENFEKHILALQEIIVGCGFKKEDLKTSEIRVYPKNERVKKGGHYVEVLTGYEFYSEMIVRFDFDSEKVGQIFASITQSKPSPRINVEFTVKDKEAVKKSLLAASAKDAKEKANILCQAMDVKLGKLQTINYNWDELKIYSQTKYLLNEERERVLYDAYDVRYNGLDFTPDDIRVDDDASFVWEITD